MHLFPPPLTIGEREGFTREKDIFDRAAIGQGLTNLISTVVDPLVVAVDAQWGSGKTTFLKMWAGELRSLGFPVIYFDAFANDYSDDAFTAIASEIVSLAREKKKQNTALGKKFVKAAVGTGKVLLRSTIKLGTKAVTLGALEAADLKSVAEDVAKELSEVEDKHIGEMITKRREQTGMIESFREALTDLPALLTVSTEQATDSVTKPLVIIVDELDRCRPLFALQILERIKHFFAVSNVHFILGTHFEQLQNSVIVAYGPQIDARTYLQKFIHLNLHLVTHSLHSHERATAKYVDHLIEAMQFDTKDNRTISVSRDYIKHLAENTDLSLRAIEQIFSTLAIALAYKPKKVLAPDEIMVGLSCLKIMRPDFYLKARSGTLTWDETNIALRLGSPAHQQHRSVVTHMSDLWQFATHPDLSSDDKLQRFGNDLARYGIERRQLVPFVANAVMDRLTPT